MNEEPKKKKLSGGVIALIVILAVGVVTAAILLAIHFSNRNNNNNNNNDTGSKATLKTNSISTDISNNDPIVQKTILLGTPSISPTGAFSLDSDKDTFSVDAKYTGAYNIDLNYTINPRTHRPGHDVGATSSLTFCFEENGVIKKTSDPITVRKTSFDGRFSINNFNLVAGKDYSFVVTISGSVDTHPESITSNVTATSINDFP